ncbi:MAG: cytochrome c oxidase subunit II [Gaiellales bacterium]
MKSLNVLSLAILGTIVGAVIGVLLVVLRTLPAEASKQAAGVDNLYAAFLFFSGIIFGIVVLILLVAVFRYRARPNDTRDGSNLHGITWLEVVWTVIPFVLVLAVAFFSWNLLNDNNVSGAAEKSGQRIHITAYQFGWKYTYLNDGIGIKDSPDLVVPVDVPIAFDITTMDVMHSFWVPAWRMQMGATPAQTNYASATPSKIGEYDIVCAFLCGVGHTQMNSAVEGGLVTKVKVVSQADFDKWVAETKAEAANA